MFLSCFWAGSRTNWSRKWQPLLWILLIPTNWVWIASFLSDFIYKYWLTRDYSSVQPTWPNSSLHANQSQRSGGLFRTGAITTVSLNLATLTTSIPSWRRRFCVASCSLADLYIPSMLPHPDMWARGSHTLILWFHLVPLADNTWYPIFAQVKSINFIPYYGPCCYT